MSNTEPLAWTPKETARRLSISPRTLNGWKNRGLIVPVRPGGVTRYLVADVLALLERNRGMSVEEATVQAAAG